MEEEIAHLRSLDLIGLQCRWQSVMGRPAPEHLPKHLLFGILAYRIQADALGDLDAGTVQLLKRAATVPSLNEVLPLVAPRTGASKRWCPALTSPGSGTANFIG